MANHRHSSSYTYTKNHSQQISHLQFSNNLSFSSTLLDEICKSIDHEFILTNSMRKKRSDTNQTNLRSSSVFKTEEQMANYQRACMIEKWMEKKVTEKIVVRGKSIAQLKLSQKDRQGSSSSSSDSSSGGFFSSSETESFPVIPKPKPVRTGGELGKIHRNSEPNFIDDQSQKSKRESGFLKTKSKALKMYGELKKVKQPISPGGKVAAFLNSIFTAGNLKKPKVAAAVSADSPSLNASACSSASSFSRSCLNKTKSSLKSSGGGKLSVRFSPASITVDEERRKSLRHENDVGFVRSAADEEVMMRLMEKTREVEEAARDFLMNYHKCEIEFLFDVENREFEEELEDDFDGESCASSDLFELDNLSAIGMDERFREELPVYETTSIDKIQTMQMA